ncbi:hypothetical protein W822_02320 [Advenella kashmirensis W13003]|uniref:DUF4202 domain-containing protein n=1 Tax=Advenella kashmirensis W13003 TaxID=1424334 RepID=V8QXL2_9BURK|nr:DUF4202 domain-containing protein [Advenella kashmirensis]ETF04035.1 hypothetical protein W822_02320 [Advenella kashmirensis W13003]
MTPVSTLAQAYAAFDAVNRTDPNTFAWQGEDWPRELFLAEKLTEWVLLLEPDASEPLQLAARCQHIGRWQIPRHDYPEGRIGYLTWRKALAHHHADMASGILRELHYDDNTIGQVQAILLKRGIKQHADVQVMENALCLVFLQYQFESFRLENEEKIVGIIQKSLLKMDDVGRQHALRLEYSPDGIAIINHALARL